MRYYDIKTNRVVLGPIVYLTLTAIGADTQLTERKIMKLTDLIEQYNAPDGVERPSQGFEQGDALSSADDIIDKLKYIREFIKNSFVNYTFKWNGVFY